MAETNEGEKIVIINKEWYEKTLALHKKTTDETIASRKRRIAEQDFFAELKQIEVKEIATKPKEELQYLPLAWAMDALHINGFAYEYAEAIENKYKELGLMNAFGKVNEKMETIDQVLKTDPTLKELSCGFVGDLIKAKKGFEKALSSLLWRESDRIVTPTLDCARELVMKLKERGCNLRGVIFLPLDNIQPREEAEQIKAAILETGCLGRAIDMVEYEEKYEPLAKHLLGNILVCDTLENATKMIKKCGHGFEVVTLDGDRFMMNGRLVCCK